MNAGQPSAKLSLDEMLHLFSQITPEWAGPSQLSCWEARSAEASYSMGMRTPILGLICATSAMLSAAPATSAPGFESLTPIVGVWQSDTSNGTSALSNCAWTATRTAVLCDQIVTTPKATLHALSLFTFEPAMKKFVFYGLSHPGDPMKPTPLSIDGKTWTYGGLTKEQDGKFYRTLNEFGAADSYTWRSQSSIDGKSWKTDVQGKSVRKK